MLSKNIADLSLGKMIKIWFKGAPEKYGPNGRGAATLWLRPSDLHTEKITTLDLLNKLLGNF